MNNKSSEITIVYIEDSDDVRFACEQTLTLAGYRVISCCDAEHSISLIQSQANIIILTDVRLPGISGLELLSYINEMDSKIPVILITGHGDVELAVDAMRNGAFDFIEKPRRQKKDDWRNLMNKVPRDLRGPEPDFSEEGWALRKPRKKKK